MSTATLTPNTTKKLFHLFNGATFEYAGKKFRVEKMNPAKAAVVGEDGKNYVISNMAIVNLIPQDQFNVSNIPDPVHYAEGAIVGTSRDSRVGVVLKVNPKNLLVSFGEGYTYTISPNLLRRATVEEYVAYLTKA